MTGLRSQKGFTLTELLVVVSVVGLLLAAALAVNRSGLQAYLTGSNRVEVQQNARTALDRIAREIREASGITTAGASSITFVAQDGVTAVTYRINANNLERNNVVVVGGVQTLTFVYRDARDITGATAANTRRINITVRTQTEEALPSGSSANTRYEVTSSVRLRNAL